VSKNLKKVIEEMGGYAGMGSGGESNMGMRSAGTVGVMGGHHSKDNKLKAYKLSDLLQSRLNSDEEEDLGDIDTDVDGMDDDMGDDNVEELKQFFIDNPAPADEEIAAYAEAHNMDLEEMRQAVYSLIQSLLPDDEEDMGDEDSMDFSVSGDTGERPASNEMGMKR